MELLDDFTLTLSNVLKKVDEYELYCYYLGFEPEIRNTYLSPLRGKGDEDTSASFSFFDSSKKGNVEYLWKDGGLDESGTISHLVMIMFGLNYNDALKKIDVDFKLGFTDGTFVAEKKLIKTRRPKPKAKTTINVCSKYDFSYRGLKYWESYYISKKTLNRFDVTELISAIINGRNIYYYDLTFAYRILETYKLYAPLKTNYRFLNNYEERTIEGFSKLKKISDNLVITKSLKDIMVLDELGFEAVSPKSESTMMPQEYFVWFNKHYKNIKVLFDNDMKHNGAKYPYDKIYVPLESGCKDISDYCKKYGPMKTKELVTFLINSMENGNTAA